MKESLPVGLLRYLKEGKIEIKENGANSVQLIVDDNRITMNLIDISFNIPTKLDIFAKISEARKFANSLKENNLTLCISNKGKVVLKLGKEAKPLLSRMVTKSGAVEITNLRELRKLDKRLRLK